MVASHQNMFARQDRRCHTHQQCIKRFMAQVMGLSGESRVDVSWSRMSWVKEGRCVAGGFGFHGGWRVGQSERLVWFGFQCQGREPGGVCIGLPRCGTKGRSLTKACKVSAVRHQKSVSLSIIQPISAFICECTYHVDSLYLVLAFKIQSDDICFLIGIFNSFTLDIIDMV